MTYGLGWFQQDYRGRAVDFHTGSIDGMVAIHGLMRDDRLGVYVLANLDHAELRHALMYKVFDRFIGAPERDWSAEFLKLYRRLKRQADEAREERGSEARHGHVAVAAAGAATRAPTPIRSAATSRSAIDGGLRLRYGAAFVGPSSTGTTTRSARHGRPSGAHRRW